jgi:hypothetical protein
VAPGRIEEDRHIDARAITQIKAATGFVPYHRWNPGERSTCGSRKWNIRAGGCDWSEGGPKVSEAHRVFISHVKSTRFKDRHRWNHRDRLSRYRPSGKSEQDVAAGQRVGVSWAVLRITLRCSEPGTHKVHGRGRSGLVHSLAPPRPRADAPRPVAELGSWATLPCAFRSDTIVSLHAN